MRKRNYTVTIRMNKEEYDLFQSKVKESGRTQQEVVIKAIADLKIASTEEVEELKRLNQILYYLNKNILKHRKESEKIWLLIRRLISGQIHMEQ